MTFDFEALVGHLYVVGGRSISAPPPGALVEVAPKKAARGRETDTFFALVLPSGDVTAPTAFYEQMAQLAAERYFSSTGSVTAALRTVFNTLNENLVEHNHSGKRHYEANMLCAVLRDADLIVARTGAGVVLLRHNGETQSFPTNLSDDEALFGPPLGVQPVPDVRMTRYTIGNGSRLILADHNLADIQLERMNTALLAADISEVLRALKGLVGVQASLMAVEFVPPDAPLPVPVQTGESTAQIVAGSKAPPIVEQPATTAEPDQADKRRDRQREASAAVQKKVRGELGRGARRLATSVGATNRLIDKVFPAPEEGKRSWLSTPYATGAVILIPVIVVLLVVTMWIGGTGESEFELCVKEVNNRAALARSIVSSDRQRTLDAWALALAKIEDCDKLRPGDPTLAQIQREGQDIIDRLNQVTRRDATPIATLPKATLTRIILQGQDLYVLDSANSQVYRVPLTSDGKAAAGSWQAIPSMRKGAIVGQYTVGDLTDITFSTDDNQIIALSQDGLVILCSPRFTQQCDAQRLLNTENWVKPSAIQIYAGKLYVLDAGKNQIWRYEPSGGVYASAPGEYFTGQSRPVITNAVDFGIDDSGNVYILLADGVVTRYRQGEAQNFGYAAFPDGIPLNSANGLFLSTSPISPGLYIVSRANRVIYETTLSGTWTKSLMIFNEDLFASVSDVSANPSQQMVYAVSGNAILAISEAQ